jgi:hypothetical protein
MSETRLLCNLPQGSIYEPWGKLLMVTPTGFEPVLPA